MNYYTPFHQVGKEERSKYNHSEPFDRNEGIVCENMSHDYKYRHQKVDLYLNPFFKALSGFSWET